jgi:succinoglycan biosynthesis transport protein ExoP
LVFSLLQIVLPFTQTLNLLSAIGRTFMNSVIFRPLPESPSQMPTGQDHGTPAGRYGQAIARGFRMHRALALAVGMAIFALLTAYALTRRPYYEASALVYVQPMKAREVTDPTEGSYDSIRYDSYIQQQMQTILRTDTLTDALTDAAQHSPHDVWTLPGESMHSAVTRLQKAVKIERETGSYQLSITLGSTNARAATELVNQIVDHYIEKERADELAQTDQQLEALRQDRVHILDELNDSTREQAQLSSSLGVADPGGTASGASSSTTSANPFDSQLAQLRSQLVDARAARAIADAQLASVATNASDPSNPLDAAAAATYANDPGLNALKQTISQRRSLLATDMAGLTPKNPLYGQDQQELKRLDQSLDSMSSELRGKAGQQVLGTLQLEAARKEDVEARLAGELQRQTAIATAATPKLQRAASVSAEVARLQARFTEVDNAINSLELEHESSGLVHLLLKAEIPASPQTSKKWIILGAALPFGLGCGLLAAMLRHRMDPRIYIADDVAPVLGFPPMAVLPNPRDVNDNVVDEFMLRLVAGIDQAHTAGEARTFVFSAVSPGTNITETVAKLALKMERLGYRTMILKASAALHSARSTEIEEPSAWNEVQLAPMADTGTVELRRGSLIAENLQRLTQKVDLLFIEALPLLSSAEAEFAVRLADITILIAESARSTRRELTSVLALVQRLNVAGVAAVLSALSLRHADPDFLAMVKSVEQRRFELPRREKHPIKSDREKVSRSILTGDSSIGRDRETTVEQ